MIRLKGDDEALINYRHHTFPATYGSLAINDLFSVAVPDPRGGLRGTCPPEEAVSALKKSKKNHVLLKEKVGAQKEL